jgi:chromosome partitioning protein
MTYILVVGGQKGGVGKSTIAEGLAVEWHRRGRAVLLVDTDPQRTVSTWAALAEEAGHKVPAVRQMSPGRLARELPRMAAAFDVTIVDTQPREAEVQVLAMAVADFALLPSQPGAHDLWALYQSMQSVTNEMKRRPAMRAGLLLNRSRQRTIAARNAIEQLGRQGVPLLSSRLSEHIEHDYASASGLGVTTYAPRSEAAREVRQLCNELEERSEGRLAEDIETLGAAELAAAVRV